MNAKENINIHHKQLFHWIGGNLDKKNGRRKILSNELAQKCLCYIQSSLEEGIWVKPPQESEEFSYNKQSFKLNRPIACFTEWSLNESLPHTGGYGRLGFGFSRKWVIERGGQSVSYFRHNAKAAPFLATIFKLLNALGKYDNAKGTWAAKGNSKQEKSAFDELVYFIHFAKMIRPRIKSDTRKKKKETKGKQLKELLGEKKEPKPLNQALQDIRDYVQDYGGKMKFV